MAKHFTDVDLYRVIKGHLDTGMSQKKLAEKLEFSEAYIGEVLKKKKPITVGLADKLGFTRVFIRKEDDHG